MPQPRKDAGEQFAAELAERAGRQVLYVQAMPGTSARGPCTLHDAFEASLIAEAATRSWREHRPVRLDDVR